MRKAASTITDTSTILVNEFGMRVNDEVGTLFIGNPGSAKYNTWIERIQQFSPTHTILNSFSQIVHDISYQENSFIVSRDARYLCQNEENAKEFIKSEIEELITKMKTISTANCRKIIISGKIYIYGIEDQSKHASLIAFIEKTERDMFSQAFCCIINFVKLAQ